MLKIIFIYPGWETCLHRATESVGCRRGSGSDQHVDSLA